MFKLEFSGSPAWTLHLWQNSSGKACRVLILGERAIVKLPPVRELCEMARENWHAIAAEVKRQTGAKEVISGEE